MTKEEMIENMIRRFTFGSKITIGFRKLVEGGVDESIIEYWYQFLMDIQDDDDEEDEEERIRDYEDNYDEYSPGHWQDC